MDLHELTAGKLAALLARSASRDVFDAHALLATPGRETAKLRLGSVVYGGINRKDWRKVAITDVDADANEVRTELVPMLSLDDAESEFLRRLNNEGEIAPELLTTDPAMKATVRGHPGLTWKAMNIRKHYGLNNVEPADEDD